MQSVIPNRPANRTRIIGYMCKGMILVFGIVLLLSYGFGLIVSLTTNEIQLTTVIVQPFIILIPFVLGWLIDKKHPGHVIAFLFLIMAYSSAVGWIVGGLGHLNQIDPGPDANRVEAITLTIGHIMWLPGVFFPIYLMPLYFPTGKLLSPKWRILVVLVLLHLVWWSIAMIFRPWPWPYYGIPDTRTPNGIAGTEAFFDAVAGVLSVPVILMYGFVPLAVFLRYRQSDQVVREQIKWPVMSIIFFLSVIFAFWSIPEFAELDAANGYVYTWFVSMTFPLSIGIAILRHRLFNIDLVINRTIVYGLLTALIIGLYITLVSMLGILIQAQTSVFNGLVATGFIAVIFQPLRARLQKIVNRLLYGERDEPEILFSRLAQHIETSNSPNHILPNLVQTIAQTLKIPYVAILESVENDDLKVLTEWGKPPEKREMISLIYNNMTIGQLVIAPRSKHERFTYTEMALLNTIAAITATTVRAVQLSEELRTSRQRIVTAREEERRRIRRDLHDGLGPQLASQTLGLEAIAQLMATDPNKAQSLIKSLQSQADEAIHDIRRLVYDLRPPALDDLGLVEALKQSISRYENPDLRFNYELSNVPDELPAAIETAIFRIAQEAITNVVRHADAALCRVRIYATAHDIHVEIKDDGQGLPDDYQSGIGLQTMCERAAELNGETVIDVLPEGGTLVKTKLPLEVFYE